MHYKNGRDAKQGDMVVHFGSNGMPTQSGILYSPTAISDTCNGRLATPLQADPYINLKDCLHVDDIAAATVPDTTAATQPVTRGAALAVLVCLAVGLAAMAGCVTDSKQVVTPASTNAQGVVTGPETNTVVTVNTNNLALDCAGVQIIAMGATMAVTIQDPSAEPELRIAQVSLTSALEGANPDTTALVIASLGQSTNVVMQAQMGKILGSVSSLNQTLLAKYGPTVAGQITLALATAACDGMTAGLAGQP